MVQTLYRPKTRVRDVQVLPGVYATPTGLKRGTKGKVAPPDVFLGTMSKSEARRIRKAARAVGLLAIATSPRS